MKLALSTDKGVQDTPIANTAKDTIILTWWVARQVVGADEVKNRSVDWRGKAALVDHVLSNEGKTIDPTRLLEEELVSPPVYSEGGGDRRMDDP